MLTIHDLTEHCLIIIFKQLPLKSQLLQLRLVCTRWQSIVEQMFYGKQSLKLFGSWINLDRYRTAVIARNMQDSIDFKFYIREFKLDEDVIILSSNSAKSSIPCSEIIPFLFPSITKLMINNCRALFEHDLPLMLRQWPNLTSLSLYSIPSPDRLPVNFWSTLNSIQSVQRLYLIHLFNCIIPEQMPILKQLECFSLVHYRGDVVPILAQLGPKCKRLNLSWIYLNVAQLEQLLQLNPQLRCNLRKLSLEYISSTADDRVVNFQKLFSLMCTTFAGLESINMMFADQLSLVTLIPQLSKLANLTELSLYIGRDQLDSSLDKLYHLPSLKSVKNLYLEIFQLTLEQFFTWFVHLFPSIEQLTLKCDYDSVDDAKQLDSFRRGLKSEFKCLRTFKIN